MKLHLLPAALLATLLASGASTQAAVIFSDNFNSYSVASDLAANYTYSAANNNIGIANGLSDGTNFTNSLGFSADATIVQKLNSANMTDNIATVEVFWKYNAGGISAPQIGFVTVNNGGFGGMQDVSGRLNNNQLVIRSNNANVTTPKPALTLTVDNWYNMTFTAQRTANLNKLFLTVAVYNADNLGNKGTLIDSASVTTVNANIYADNDVFAALRSSRVLTLDNFSMSTSPIPEPGAPILLGLALTALVVRRRR